MTLVLLCALLALYVSPSLASFRIVTPALATASEIDHQLALFGRPSYGSSLVAPLTLAPPANTDGCAEFHPLEFNASLASNGISVASRGDDEDGAEPFVLLVARGNCHFVAKVRHAQSVGAVAVVIYNSQNDDAKLPVIADDGTGGDIRIPSLLIHHKDALPLIDLLGTGIKPVVAIRWDVPHPDDRVEFSLWFSSRATPKLQGFINNFGRAVKALGDSVLFTPVYDVHAGSAWGCSRGNASPTNCPQLCVHDSAFCTYDPERNNTIGLDGYDVLEEDVRQLCIYQYAQAKNNHSAAYWEYLAAFNSNCSGPDATATEFNKACSEDVQNALGIPSIVECVDNEESVKAMLQSQIDALRTFHVIDFPEFTVNGVPMFGGIECELPISLATCAPLKMICTGFQDRTAPEACEESFWKMESGCEAQAEKDDCGTCSVRGSPQWNSICAGCDGVPYSGKHVDECGVCGGDGSFDICGRCLPATDASRDRSCVDCKGVPNGFAQRDACGVCGGHGSFDACGLCLDAQDPRRQNFACHVMEDPDAVKGKLEIQGIGMKQFRGSVVQAFQEAVAVVADVRSDQVLVKTVDALMDPQRGSMILFFVACETERCRGDVSMALQQPAAANAIAAEMKLLMESEAYGLEPSKSIEKVTLHALNEAAVAATSAQGEAAIAHSSTWWCGVVVACAVTLAIGIMLVRVREDRIRRDFQALFARYTPLTTMDYEEENEYGQRPATGAGAGAW